MENQDRKKLARIFCGDEFKGVVTVVAATESIAIVSRCNIEFHIVKPTVIKTKSIRCNRQSVGSEVAEPSKDETQLSSEAGEVNTEYERNDKLNDDLLIVIGPNMQADDVLDALEMITEVIRDTDAIC